MQIIMLGSILFEKIFWIGNGYRFLFMKPKEKDIVSVFYVEKSDVNFQVP